MESQAQSPAWSDGQANRELLDSLDAIGGAGSDLADQEVFKMLDEIEKLANEKLRASDLLRGTGQANEPKLNPTPSAEKAALLTEQFKELPEFSETSSATAQKPRDEATASATAQPHKTSVQIESTPAARTSSVADEAVFLAEFSPEPRLGGSGSLGSSSQLSGFEALDDSEGARSMRSNSRIATPSTAPSSNSHLSAQNNTESSKPSLQNSNGQPSNKTAYEAIDSGSPETSYKSDLKESREVASTDRAMEIGAKKNVDPEKFLPPDFFDPRDRKPPKRWGRWLALALLIVGMTTIAGYLVMKTYKDSRPAATRSIGDLTKPATR